MTLAIRKPGYLETLTEPSSAALNLAFASFKASAIALLMAVLAGPAETATRIRTDQPNNVPPSVSDLQIQCRGSGVSGRRPCIVKLLLREVEAMGQQAACAQEHRMLFHPCAFLTVDAYVERAGST